MISFFFSTKHTRWKIQIFFILLSFFPPSKHILNFITIRNPQLKEELFYFYLSSIIVRNPQFKKEIMVKFKKEIMVAWKTPI